VNCWDQNSTVWRTTDSLSALEHWQFGTIVFAGIHVGILLGGLDHLTSTFYMKTAYQFTQWTSSKRFIPTAWSLENIWQFQSSEKLNILQYVDNLHYFILSVMFWNWLALIVPEQQPTGSLGKPIVNCWDQNSRVWRTTDTFSALKHCWFGTIEYAGIPFDI